ncbi:NAD(+)--rifampin ADP-ribosyltransferase [Streptomyces sp. NPDC048281]|uniref:NAD(+)--rifampin ADP-ribosyltransferase n=1 Tax=Streptomyces sp. NPDC048281 TaxID=3154715 RepID=UPI0034312A94
MPPKTYTWTGMVQTAYRYEERTFTIEGPLYHGGGKRLRKGAQLTAGRRTNREWGDEGARSRYIHFTTRLDVAAEYARLTGGHVYEVDPTGEFSHGYNGGEYKSEHPLNVVRRLDPQEWQ